MDVELHKRNRAVFDDSWLKNWDWVKRNESDKHEARCSTCCRSIKLENDGEAALINHSKSRRHINKTWKKFDDDLKEEFRRVNLPLIVDPKLEKALADARERDRQEKLAKRKTTEDDKKKSKKAKRGD